jgi:hypothetical protein
MIRSQGWSLLPDHGVVVNFPSDARTMLRVQRPLS